MHRLAKALRGYILERSNNDFLWKGLTIIFSDAFVPGEGEHKILDFIRTQRSQKDYKPDTSHCIYGADADLIMLGLSTHETHFFILREVFMNPNDKVCHKCKQRGHVSNECTTDYAKDKVRL
jgi:5'-3' exoribonuclease 2